MDLAINWYVRLFRRLVESRCVVSRLSSTLFRCDVLFRRQERENNAQLQANQAQSGNVGELPERSPLSSVSSGHWEVVWLKRITRRGLSLSTTTDRPNGFSSILCFRAIDSLFSFFFSLHRAVAFFFFFFLNGLIEKKGITSFIIISNGRDIRHRSG